MAYLDKFSIKRLMRIQTVAGILSAIVSFIAIILGIVTIYFSNTQFNLNTTTSQKSLDLQLQNAKILNDSLIYQIDRLRSVLNFQMDVLTEQSNVTKKNISDQVILQKPNVTISLLNVINDPNYSEKKSRIEISTTFINNGYRTAKNLINLSCVMPFQLDTCVFNNSVNYAIDLGQNKTNTLAREIKFNKKYTSYYIFNFFEFYDPLLKKHIQNYGYDKFDFNYNNNMQVMSCTVEEIKLVQRELKKLFKDDAYNLFKIR